MAFKIRCRTPGTIRPAFFLASYGWTDQEADPRVLRFDRKRDARRALARAYKHPKDVHEIVEAQP